MPHTPSGKRAQLHTFNFPFWDTWRITNLWDFAAFWLNVVVAAGNAEEIGMERRTRSKYKYDLWAAVCKPIVSYMWGSSPPNCRCCTNTNEKNRIRTYARLSSHPVPVLQAHDYGKAIKIHQGSGTLIFMQYLMTYSQRKLVYMKLKWVLIENITWVRLTHPFTMIMQR